MRVAKANGQQAPQQNQATSVLALSVGQADTSAIRTETWQGQEYTVVPVVAIVEGVLFGANASAPEFAPASEFGKVPEGWNGRPVTYGHPKVNGLFVSASNPQVLEDNAMGMMFNTKLEDNKLKTEAWLNTSRINELGGDILATYQKIVDGELVEVSVGAFIEVIQTPGVFAGKNYSGVWSNVVPDHLAFLEEGVPGACSVADGCGVPRLNAQNAVEVTDLKDVVTYSTSCCESCAEGNPCSASQNHTHVNIATFTSGVSSQFEALVRAERGGEILSHLSIESVDPSIDLWDLRQMVFGALVEHLSVPSYDLEILALTTEQVAYYVWDYNSKFMYNALAYSADSNGNISFTGDPVPVNVVTRIVPRNVENGGLNVNEDERTNDMPGNEGDGQNGGTTTTTTETPAAGAVTQEGTGVSANSGQSVQPVKLKSFSELLQEADPATRQSIEYGMQAYTARKNELIAGIKALEHNPYSDEQLAAMEVPALEQLGKLANVNTFSGRAQPSQEDGTSVSVNQNSRKFAASTSYLGATQE